MTRFLDWLNNNNQLDPVMKAAIAHFWFIIIHPFDDGNGRIGRAISDMLLARSENSAERFYSMSSQILIERKQYYKVLQKVQHSSGDITESVSGTPGTAVGVSKICIGSQAPTEAQLQYGAAVVVSFKDASGKRCTRSVVTYGQALQEIARDYTVTGEVGKSIISQYEVASTLIE